MRQNIDPTTAGNGPADRMRGDQINFSQTRQDRFSEKAVREATFLSERSSGKTGSR